MFIFIWFSYPDGITPNSGLTEPNNTYIYIYIYIRGTFNKFPNFFVLAFKIVVDS